MKRMGWHFWVVVALLVAGGTFINLWERAGEARIERRQLREFPAELGAWRKLGADQRFDQATEAVLRADDYLARDYALPDGRAASLYVGFYATQRQGSTYHSPLNCLPGTGWEMSEAGRVRIAPADGGRPFDANRYIVARGENRHLLVYWYQGRGRAVASEYWARIYTVLDSASRRRSDGAMVRVLIPVGRAEAEAVQAATDLAAQSAAHLSAFVPD